MSARRPPSEDSHTEVYDRKPETPRARTATRKGFDRGAVGTSVPTIVARPPRTGSRPVELATPTDQLSEQDLRPIGEHSSPVVAISMKTPGAAARSAEPPPVVGNRVQLRSLDELGRHKTAPGQLGYLAPPRDAGEVRARRLRDYVIWGSVVIMVGCVVTLAVWFLARS